MRIKKHPTGNEYVRAGGLWVRNFTKATMRPTQLQNMFPAGDYGVVTANEELNKNHPKISDEKLVFRKVVVVSDGYDFAKRHKVVSSFPKDVAVFAVNGALGGWTLFDAKTPAASRRSINCYVTNNPYRDCLSHLPADKTYTPACVASVRTNHEFLRRYKGDVYTYVPAPDQGFGPSRNENYCVDDYRNPVSACVCLAHQFGVRKLMLLCCDDSFEGGRDFAVRLGNGLWSYPQHVKAQRIVDAQLYWLTHQKDKDVAVADYSSGIEHTNAVYITGEEEAAKFFLD